MSSGTKPTISERVSPDDAERDLASIFAEYQRPIFNYLLRMTQDPALAEDLTQEAFIRVHRGLPEFRGDASLSTWIYRIATNVSLDYFRSKGSKQGKSTISLEETEDARAWIPDESTTTPEQAADQAEMSACVQRFIRDLPPDYRAALILSDLQGLKNREIADVLGVSLDTVKIRLHRARTKLRGELNLGCDFSHDERNVMVCEDKNSSEET